MTQYRNKNRFGSATLSYLNIDLLNFRFLLFGKGQTWNISRIENTFLEGILLLKPDEACLCHVALSRLIELGAHAIDEVEWSTVQLHNLIWLKTQCLVSYQYSTRLRSQCKTRSKNNRAIGIGCSDTVKAAKGAVR